MQHATWPSQGYPGTAADNDHKQGKGKGGKKNSMLGFGYRSL